MIDRAKADPKIKFMVPYVVTETLFNKCGVNGNSVKNTETGEEEELIVDGLFYAIGHNPNSEIFKPYVDTDEHGYIVVKDFTKTKTPGVFAAGDIADPNFAKAYHSCWYGGVSAAIQAQHYIEALS